MSHQVIGVPRLFAERTGFAPAAQSLLGASVAIPRLGVSRLPGAELDTNDIVWTSLEQPVLLRRADDVVWRAERSAHVAHTSRVKAKSPEGIYLWHFRIPRKRSAQPGAELYCD
jgi:hypothetical protein